MFRARLTALVTLILSLAIIAPASAAERLKLRFREGQTIRYQYVETMRLQPPAKFAGVAEDGVLTAKVDFTFKVTKVNPDSSAIVKLRFDRIVVEKDGTQVADIVDHQVPSQAQDVTAILGINGEVSFYKYVYLTFNRANMLEFRIVTGGNSVATHSISAESENEVFAADLDVTTGLIRVGLPPSRTVSDPGLNDLAELKLDLTPRKMYELLLLPTAPLDADKRFVVPHRYLANEVITYQGRSDVQGKTCEHVRADVTPWEVTEASPSGEHAPQLSGQISYFIDTDLGRLVTVKGDLREVIRIPGVGEQAADVQIALTPRR